MQFRFSLSSSFVLSIFIFIAGCDKGSMKPPADMAATASDMTTGSDAGPSATTLSLIAGGLGGAGNADGTGGAARFFSPQGVARDNAGYLYVADTNNNTIRKVEISTGKVSTLAGKAGVLDSIDGTGADARFNSPQGLISDSDGANLYVADSGNNTIRKVVLSTGEVITVAGKLDPGSSTSVDGTGDAARFNFPEGLAIHGTDLYVADTNNCTIRKLDLTTRGVITLAGSPAACDYVNDTADKARFDHPVGLAIDSAGNNLYAAENNSQHIRKVDLSVNAVSALAAKDETGAPVDFSNPVGVAIDNTIGNLYISESANNTIRQLVIATGVVSTLAGKAGELGDDIDGTGDAARFNSPAGVAIDGANLYVADSQNNTIRKVVVEAGVVSTAVGAAVHVGSSNGTGDSARFNVPAGVASDGAGNLYIADTQNNTIRKVKITTGEVITVAGTAGLSPDPLDSGDGTGPDARFNYPQGVAIRGTNLYVADTYSNTIRKMDLLTNVVSTIAGAADPGSVDPSTGQNGTGADARFSGPTGLAFDSSGNLYVSDSYNNTIRQVVIPTTGDAVVSTIAGAVDPGDVDPSTGQDGTGADARFNGPMGLASDGANLYVADTGNFTVRKVVILTTGEAVVTTLAGVAGETGYEDKPGLDARFKFPFGVACDGAGNVYVADSFNNAIRKIVIASQTVSTFAGVEGVIGASPGPLPGVLDSPTALAALSPTRVVVIDESSVFITY
jgi:DNA-binding beta-propeller fold protein YncE